jgi:adenosylcobinamide-GDP ribazoletransferase
VFLTVIPLRRRDAPPALGVAAGWFAVVGAAIGALAGAVRVAADDALGPGPASILAVIALVAVTGALHQDGLADCADGLGVRGDRQRRLGAMRDSAIGAYGTLALVLWALLLSSALSGLEASDALRALVVAAALGRAAAVLHAHLAAPARADGLGAGFAIGVPALLCAAATAAAAALLLVDPLHALLAVALAAAIGAATAAWARSSLGGRTGDTLGATVTLGEVAVCVLLLGLR